MDVMVVEYFKQNPAYLDHLVFTAKVTRLVSAVVEDSLAEVSKR